ncbi:DUF1015 domain-containing protein [Bacteroidota bacterium]
MAILKSFKGFRPKAELAAKIASRPYDVLNSEEARREVEVNPYSFLRVVKPEVDLPPETDHYSDVVYQTGKNNLERMIEEGTFFQDENPSLYVYAQTMNGVTQYGLVGCASILDYINNVIRKHELTRPDKEEDRKKHIRISNFNAEPVFFAYPPHVEIDQIVEKIVQSDPEYDFVAEDGIRHQVWVIGDEKYIKKLEAIFATDIPFTYVADGHHRTAAAAGVGEERRKADKNHNGREEYNYFLAVLFPADQLSIIDYNRVVKDLNGLSESDFIDKLKSSFEVKEQGKKIFKPTRLHEFGMYISGNWYSLQAKEGTYDDHDPIGQLDVTVLSEHVLSPLLDITDLRKSKRIDFVGGIRGLEELERRVDSDEMKVAFALYPVSMEQLMDIADTGNIMPPKTTWFEPKLRSGLLLHNLDD